jgi:hypothetical protein
LQWGSHKNAAQYREYVRRTQEAEVHLECSRWKILIPYINALSQLDVAQSILEIDPEYP